MNGALAHLARATDWQSVGDRFESDMLHNLAYIKHLGNIQQRVFPFVIDTLYEAWQVLVY